MNDHMLRFILGKSHKVLNLGSPPYSSVRIRAVCDTNGSIGAYTAVFVRRTLRAGNSGMIGA